MNCIANSPAARMRRWITWCQRFDGRQRVLFQNARQRDITRAVSGMVRLSKPAGNPVGPCSSADSLLVVPQQQLVKRAEPFCRASNRTAENMNGRHRRSRPSDNRHRSGHTGGVSASAEFFHVVHQLKPESTSGTLSTSAAVEISGFVAAAFESTLVADPTRYRNLLLLAATRNVVPFEQDPSAEQSKTFQSTSRLANDSMSECLEDPAQR